MKNSITKIVVMAFLMLFAGFQAISALTFTVQVPEETKVVYIIGDFTNDWANFIKMQNVGENTFSITIDDATPDMWYEYCSGPGWGYAEIDADGNEVSRQWSASDVAVGFMAYYTPVTLTYTAQVPSEVESLYITGEPVGSWGRFVKMNNIGDNKFSITLDEVSEDMGYQYSAGPGWAYQEVDADGKGLGRTWSELDNAEYFMAYPEPVTYTVQVPAGTKEVYIVGDAVGGWDRFIKLHQVDETTFSVTLDYGSQDAEYEYCAGPGWDYEECDENGDTYGIGGWTDLDEVPGFVDSFDPTASNALTYTVQVPAETDVVYYEFDGGDGWMNYAEMQRVDETTFSITFPATKDMGYSYCAGPSEDFLEIDADGNEVTHDAWAELDKAFGFMDYDVSLSSFTGIHNPALEKTDLICSSVNHVITVTGTFNEVSIYDITGRKIQSEKVKNYFESKPVNTGIYLVKTDKQVEKVIAR